VYLGSAEDPGNERFPYLRKMAGLAEFGNHGETVKRTFFEYENVDKLQNQQYCIDNLRHIGITRGGVDAASRGGAENR
jgi:hypothetical protein